MKNTFFVLLTILTIFFQSCDSNSTNDMASATAPDGKEYRVAVIQYQHETCTFCPGGDTEIEDWTTNRPYVDGDELLKGDSYIRGFVHTARLWNDIELVPIKSPDFVFGGSSRSWNSKESFDHFMKIILDDLEAKKPIDGVYLALHGAMAVRDIPRPEAEIAKRIREALGEDVPIVASFDLHGNEDGEFLEWADAAFVTKRYPHYDAFLQGERSANFINRALKGDYKATTASRKPPILTATVLQWTGASPSMDIMERARRWESRVPDAYVSVFYGFPWSDVPDIGTTVHVVTNNDQQMADSIANDMEEFIMRVKEDFAGGNFPMPKEAVKMTRQAIKKGETPVVLGDYSDRPGDATWILKELMDKKVEKVLYACLRDERALEALERAGAKPGDPFDMEIGGFTGEQAGKAVRVQGEVVYFDEMWKYDKVACIKYGKNNMLIITPTYEQVTTLRPFEYLPINPDDYDVFVVKSRVHFRRGFDETGYAKTIHVVDAPGPWFGTTRLDALDYEFGPINNLYPFNQ
ncbi:MAG: M81 family metallopeptidase [Bacteroidota bacterium]